MLLELSTPVARRQRLTDPGQRTHQTMRLKLHTFKSMRCFVSPELVPTIFTVLNDSLGTIHHFGG